MAVAVGGAFHTPFMAPARNRLRKALREATFHQPEVTVVANVDALPHQTAEDWQSLLSAQLCSPVRWRQTVLQLAGLAGNDPADHQVDGESGADRDVRPRDLVNELRADGDQPRERVGRSEQPAGKVLRPTRRDAERAHGTATGPGSVR